MGEAIRHTGTELKARWLGKMPTFFRRIVIICTCIVGTALTVNQVMVMGGATPHEWWNDVYPLLLGVPTGMAVICKLTVAGGYKDIDPDKIIRNGRMVDRDEEAPNMSDVETQHPTD
ncbi:MAG: hypothetical protein K6B13_08185 [Prevotella sp.]|nr:hypothetical protein [Prevotella sp.]